MRLLLLLSLISIFLFQHCKQASTAASLPIIDPTPEDSVDYTIPAFQFVDQDSNVITEAFIRDKITVADFFFTTCPDICPRMSQQMLRLHDSFQDEPDVVLISHTLDPDHDTVATLKAYAKALDAHTEKWHMLTTEDEDYVYEVCRNYLLSASPEESVMGGILHSGKFVLLDRKSRIRGFYEGTNPEEVDQLIEDIKGLLNGEEES